MKAIQPYLTFNGNCREAMEFYAKALGGKLEMTTFAEAPGAPMADAGSRIMHARITDANHLHGDALLMASDMPPGRTEPPASGFSLSVMCESREEEERLFAAMSEGGDVTMPLQDTFWGAHFGMLHDKFGIRWMFDYTPAVS